MVFAVKEFSRDMKQTIEMVDLEAATAAEKQGVTLVNWSKEERRKFRKIAMEEWEVWANKSPMARKIVDSQVAFLRKLKLID
jgi:TRAP-type mannitol/chloroaromatic compound transport system substrate-binding protein